MKIKLIESAQPIEKLEHNIINNIIPEFNKYDLGLTFNPDRVDDYELVFRGVSKKYRVTTKLRLLTTSPEIDIWNETNTDLFYADLFAELRFDGDVITVGCISSKNPSSVDYEMESISFDEYTPVVEEKKNVEEKKEELIEPLGLKDKYKPMTRKQWLTLKKQLEDNIDKLEKQIEDSYSEEEQNKIRQQWYKKEIELPPLMQQAMDAHKKYRTFLSVYPL